MNRRRVLVAFHPICKLSTTFENSYAKTQTYNQYNVFWQAATQKDKAFSPPTGVGSGTRILQNVRCLIWYAKLT